MSTRAPSRVVFVGNIPYGLSEEQIIDIFSSAGKVEKFRLVYDSETGKPKGFGFAEYPDVDSASSAVRNLNDYDIMGRKLRVDFSNDQRAGDDDNQPSTYNSNAANGNAAASYAPTSGTIPPLPAGKELGPGITCTDAISRTINTLPPQQLLEILGQMKTLATNEPQRAAELLQQAPQLSYAVCEALLLMGLVTPQAIQSIVDPSAPPAAAAPPPAAAYGQPAAMPGYMGGPVANNTPPVAANPYAPPPAAAAAPPGQDTDALMRAVMELPQAQIDMLPEAERQQILALRAQFGGGRR